MDPTSLFFSRLRRLAVTLESETECLQAAYQTRDDRGDDESVTERGMGAYHTLCTELAHLKGEIRARLAQELSREAEVKSYLAACGVMKRRLSEDIHRLKGHFEKYGYQAPPSTQPQVKGHVPEPADLGEEKESGAVEEEEEGERKDPLPSSPPPQSAPPQTVDQLRTPKLSDFGLSELDLRRILVGANRCPEAPPMPVLSHPPLPSSLATPLPPALLLTPRCVLRMEEDEGLRTPQIKDFGISDGALRLDSNAAAAPPPTTNQLRTPQLSDFGLSEADLQGVRAQGCAEAPPMPALSFTQASSATPFSPTAPLTPRCALRMEDEEQRTPQMKDFGISQHTLCLNNDFTMDLHRLATRSTNQQPPPQPVTQDPLPESVDPRSEMMSLTPEMPIMESMFSSTLLSKSTRGASKSGDPSGEAPVYSSLEVDGPTLEFNLRTPRVRLAYQDPQTPEMPDLSSITQDICKLVSRAELKKERKAVLTSPRAVGKENRDAVLPLVVESEYQSLPRYLRQMSLASLNDTVQKINSRAAANKHLGEALQFDEEELKRVTGAGTMAPIYILCLEELHRLEHVQSSSVYKLLPQH